MLRKRFDHGIGEYKRLSRTTNGIFDHAATLVPAIATAGISGQCMSITNPPSSRNPAVDLQRERQSPPAALSRSARPIQIPCEDVAVSRFRHRRTASAILPTVNDNSTA